MEAIDECGAPVVSIAGGEPLLHKDMPKIVKGFLAKNGKPIANATNVTLPDGRAFFTGSSGGPGAPTGGAG